MHNDPPVPFQLFIEHMRIRPKAKLPRNAYIKTSFNQLCAQAKILCRATVPHRTIIVHRGYLQLRARDFDIVSIPVHVKSLRSRVAALRALEALALSFFDHATRHTLLGRGYFVTPKVTGYNVDARVRNQVY